MSQPTKFGNLNKEEQSGTSVLHAFQSRILKIYEHKLLFETSPFKFYIVGSISQDLGNLLVTLLVEDTNTGRKDRAKLDLYNSHSVRKFAEQLSEKSGNSSELIEVYLIQLTDELEVFREKQFIESVNTKSNKRQFFPVSPDSAKDCITFLKKKNLIEQIDKYIQQSGVVGEDQTRTLLFIISLSYKMNEPLHSLIQASCGAGKSFLINAIGSLMPNEDVLSITRVSSKSFYHYLNDELVYKVLLIQDFEGLNEDAKYAFRELQSAGVITSSTTVSDKNGNLKAEMKTVRGHFASMSATAKDTQIEDVGKTILIGIDESLEQTQRIIDYQNKKLAGVIDIDKEYQAKIFLQDCIRTLSSYEVVNPYADKIQLPVEAKFLRRLNANLQALIKVITILHQFQREKDINGRLITLPQDIKSACELLFSVLILKVDDLDPSLRQFFNSLKKYIQNPSIHFTKLEIRQALYISKTQCFRYIKELEKLEYIQKVGGHINRGFKYRISNWDDTEKIKTQIKANLNDQLAILEQKDVLDR